MVQRDRMPTFEVQTANARYPSVVERGILRNVAEFLPAHFSSLYIVTSRDVWDLHGASIDSRIRDHAQVIFFPGGEANKRLHFLEDLADQLLARGADRTSVVIGFGGGIVTDISGFLAAIFMRGIPVLQIPTTLLAQVDAAVGGKTGVNLREGKNLIGSFHQPLAVLIDGDVLDTLPENEYRAGLFEVIKCAIIRDRSLFEFLQEHAEAILARQAEAVDHVVSGAVRIKAEIVSADERESDLRRILNFGHTVGHALESETSYTRFLHGEAVGWGMLTAIRIAELSTHLASNEAARMNSLIRRYGPLPSAANLDIPKIFQRLYSDKKTLSGKIHFVLPSAIGQAGIVSALERSVVEQAIVETLQ